MTPDQVKIIVSLAGTGFASPPMITTSHAGSNFFLFSPKPGLPRLGPTKRHVYEMAMNLVAAVRQGQLLPAQYAIRSPTALLTALRDRKALRASTEAMQQYRTLVAAPLRLGRLIPEGGDFYSFELIDSPENLEAVELAIGMVRGDSEPLRIEEDAVLAFRKGQTYVESLVGRQKLVEQEQMPLDPETEQEVTEFMMGL